MSHLTDNIEALTFQQKMREFRDEWERRHPTIPMPRPYVVIQNPLLSCQFALESPVAEFSPGNQNAVAETTG